MRTLSTSTAMVALASSVILGSCADDSGSEGGDRPARPFLIKDASVRGIGLRDRKKDLLRVFGAPRAREWEGLIPEGYPAPDFLGGLEAVKYPGISFTFYRNGRVASFVAYSDWTRTARGVVVGDRLDKARSVYRAACKPEIETESDVIVAQCWKRLGPGRHIAFAAYDGSENIGSIAVSAEPFPNGCGKGGFAPRSTARRCMREALTGRAAPPPRGR